MKLRHAAALALMAWYLMAPLIDPASRFDPRYKEQQPDLKAPLNQWYIDDTFDTLKDCQYALSQVKTKTGYWSYARCASSDDPQLKGKKLNFVPEEKPSSTK